MKKCELCQKTAELIDAEIITNGEKVQNKDVCLDCLLDNHVSGKLLKVNSIPSSEPKFKTEVLNFAKKHSTLEMFDVFSKLAGPSLPFMLFDEGTQEMLNDDKISLSNIDFDNLDLGTLDISSLEKLETGELEPENFDIQNLLDDNKEILSKMKSVIKSHNSNEETQNEIKKEEEEEEEEEEIANKKKILDKEKIKKDIKLSEEGKEKAKEKDGSSTNLNQDIGKIEISGIKFSNEEDEEEYLDTFDEADEDSKADNTLGGFIERIMNISGAKFQGSKPTGTKVKEEKSRRKYRTLDKFAEDLNEKAKMGKIDKLVGRSREIDRVLQILSRRNKNNPVLLGEPGVGKTAIAEGIALRIVEGLVPRKIKKLKIFLLDMTSVVAGTQFRGQFESRMKAIMKEAKNLGNIVLVIDELHTIVGAGEVSGSAMCASNILKPALAKGEVQVIGATTLEEYRQNIEKDSALERRFQKVIVDEPSEEECVDIIKGIKHYYEDFHNVEISDEIIERAVYLSKRYINDRFLPDKAIDLIDEAAAKINLNNIELEKFEELNNEILKIIELKEKASLEDDFENAAKYKSEEIIIRDKLEKLGENLDKSKMKLEDIAKVLEDWTKIPASDISLSEAKKLLSLPNNLKEKVLAQDEAIEAISKAIKRSRSGFRQIKKPSSFIFVGPTGVGKTELTKVLAEEVFGSRDNIIRLDMSEYMEKHSVSKIIGAPPGYVGFEGGGQLTEKVRRNPYSVILLDEIEKAHHDIFNILLQILDDGRLTDSNGRLINFENTIIIMTSNAGTSTSLGDIGFSSSEKEKSKDKVISELKEIFRPEFLGRVDDVIIFNHLKEKDLENIFELQINEIKDYIKQKEIELKISKELKNYIVKENLKSKYDARTMRKSIQKNVEDYLSEIYLESELKDGDTIMLDYKNGEIVHEIIK